MKIETEEQFNKYIDKIIKEEIKKDKSMLGYSDQHILVFRQNRIQNELYEGLILSQPMSKVFTVFNNKFKDKLKLSRNNIFNLKVSLIPFSINKQYYNEVIQLMNNLGWFLSVIEYKKNDKIVTMTNINLKDIDGDYVNLYFESKFDLLIDNKFLPKFIYHISLKQYKDKILKSGLIPKTKSKLTFHPERIYFLSKEKDYIELSKQLYPTETEFILIKINTTHLKDKRFIIDPNKINGIFTLENISPSNIEEIIEFNI
jgi:hypothetical protein